ncbi:MAG: O-antigen ligase family protein, partial [Lentisphaerota bacterium]
KYFEYFFLFFMILAHIRRLQDLRGMVTAMLLVFFLASVYGYYQMALGVRVSAPFDAEPNTFGGYLALMICVALGVVLTDTRPNVRMILIALLLFALPPFLFTLSRSSYIALFAGLAAFVMVSRQRLVVLAVTIAVGLVVLAGFLTVPHKLQSRVMDTFKKGTQYHVQVAGVDLDPSSSARVLSYREAIRIWVQRPLFGYGVTGTLFVDGQYLRLLAETGLMGLGAFLFMFAQLLRAVWTSYCRARDPYLKGAAMGFFCGVIAMLAHATAANSFIIIRIAEPLWLLAGLVLLIPHLEEAEQEEPVSNGQAAPAV